MIEVFADKIGLSARQILNRPATLTKGYCKWWTHWPKGRCITMILQNLNENICELYESDDYYTYNVKGFHIDPPYRNVCLLYESIYHG